MLTDFQTFIRHNKTISHGPYISASEGIGQTSPRLFKCLTSYAL